MLCVAVAGLHCLLTGTAAAVKLLGLHVLLRKALLCREGPVQAESVLSTCVWTALCTHPVACAPSCAELNYSFLSVLPCPCIVLKTCCLACRMLASATLKVDRQASSTCRCYSMWRSCLCCCYVGSSLPSYRSGKAVPCCIYVPTGPHCAQRGAE